MKNKYFSSLINALLSTFLICSLAEAFTYSGFLAKHFSVQMGLGIFLIFITCFLFFYKLYKSKFLRKTTFVLVCLMTLAYLLFDVLEKSNYLNYVFSHFHLHPYLLLLPDILMLCIFLLNGHKKNANVLMCIIPAIILVQYITSDYAVVKGTQLIFAVKNMGLDYDKKMERAVGKIPYNYILFIKDNTSEDSTILIPPQGYPWDKTSNEGYLRYFLFPRHLVNGKEYDPKVNVNSVDYVLVDYGETTISEYGFTNIWPKFDVKGEYVIYWSPETGETRKDITGIYKYNENDKSEKWGLIKIKH